MKSVVLTWIILLFTSQAPPHPLPQSRGNVKWLVCGFLGLSEECIYMHIHMCLYIYILFFIPAFFWSFFHLTICQYIHIILLASALYSLEWIQQFNGLPVGGHLDSLQFFTVIKMLQWTIYTQGWVRCGNIGLRSMCH